MGEAHTTTTEARSSGAVLVVNAGSTSLKLSLVDVDGAVSTVATLDAVPQEVGAVGHRVVHGGARFVEPVLIDDGVIAELAALTELAPLHSEAGLAAVDAARRARPDLPHVAVFDTAFHKTLPEEAATYAVPARWRRELGVRRFGFHGLSVEWAAECVDVPLLVVCHLGGGCSVTAVREGRSVDTSMGFTPLEGLPMATRSGSVDPGLLLYLLRTHRLTVAELEQALEHDSGLLGLSALSPHVRELEQAEAGGDDGAQLALAVYTRHVARAIAAACVSLGGLDALVFTGGVGEGSAAVRERVCARLGFLGVQLDPVANRANGGTGEIAAARAAVRVVVVPAREDIVIARAVRRRLDMPRQRLI